MQQFYLGMTMPGAAVSERDMARKGRLDLECTCALSQGSIS